MIENIVEKLIRTEKRISEEKVDFNFFGLFKRADLEGAWDIIISASWFSDNKREDLAYIVEEIKKDLLVEDLRLLARVVLIDPKDELIKKLNAAVAIQHGKIEMINNTINGFKLGHAYIITSKR